jgi:MFS family permease
MTTTPEEDGPAAQVRQSALSGAAIGIATEPPYPSKLRAWFLVSVLIVAYTFSFLDRQVLSLLVEDIERDLHISDTAIGFLHGFTFALFYSIAGLPIARLIDSGPRKYILAAGIFAWSLTTAMCGFASRYLHLLVLRIGVAVGEATLLPATNSLVADSFPPERRAFATAVFGLGLPFGIGLSVLFGGVLINAIGDQPVQIPLLGEFAPWQTIFIAIGLPGLLVALVALLVHEPARRGEFYAAREAVATVPIRVILKHMAEHRRTFGLHITAACFGSMVGYGYIAWIPTFYVREFGWGYGDIGVIYGLLTLALGTTSTLASGWLADNFYARGHRNGKIRSPLIFVALSAPPAILFPLLGDIYMSFVFLGLFLFFSYGIWATTSAVIQDLAPGPMRGQVTAIYTGILNLVGLGLGPVGIAVVTEHVFGDPKDIKYSMALFAIVGSAIAIAAWTACLKPYAATARAADVWTDGGESAVEAAGAAAPAVLGVAAPTKD